MALMLLYERDIVGSASHLKHYISDLEAIDIDTPVAWLEAEVAALQYPYLQEEIGKQKAAWNELYEQAASASSKRILRKDLIWAMQAVRSRAFSGPYSGELPAFQDTLLSLEAPISGKQRSLPFHTFVITNGLLENFIRVKRCKDCRIRVVLHQFCHRLRRRTLLCSRSS